MSNDELPEGWEWLSRWDRRTPEERKKGGPTGDYARLMKAADAQKIRAFKQGSAWAVHAQDARQYIAACHGRIAEKSTKVAAELPPELPVREFMEQLQSLVRAAWAISSVLDDIADEITMRRVEVKDTGSDAVAAGS